jgi:hypothetical protein
LSEHFENELWFVCHTANIVAAILDFLPENVNMAVMVNSEVQHPVPLGCLRVFIIFFIAVANFA